MPFTPRQKHERYKKLRDKLESLVGDKFVLCGNTDAGWHFDHPFGRDYDVTTMDSYARLKLYLEDFKKGNGRRLCSTCNSSDGGYRSHYGD